jgi:hypothetical protein
MLKGFLWAMLAALGLCGVVVLMGFFLGDPPGFGVVIGLGLSMWIFPVATVLFWPFAIWINKRFFNGTIAKFPLKQ